MSHNPCRTFPFPERREKVCRQCSQLAYLCCSVQLAIIRFTLNRRCQPRNLFLHCLLPSTISFSHPLVPPDDVCAQAQSVVASLQALEIMAPSVDPSLKPQLLSLLPLLLTSLCSHFTAVRHMAARCIATLAQVDLHQTMEVDNGLICRPFHHQVFIDTCNVSKPGDIGMKAGT